jgi:hypothetical protein
LKKSGIAVTVMLLILPQNVEFVENGNREIFSILFIQVVVGVVAETTTLDTINAYRSG